MPTLRSAVFTSEQTRGTERGCIAREERREFEDLMVKKRNRTKHTATFEERLAQQAQEFKEAAKSQPDGSKAQDLLLRRAQQLEAASLMNRSLGSGAAPGDKVDTV
jgi:hypothetical protein